MRLPAKETWLRAAFVALAWFVITKYDFVVFHVLRAPEMGAFLFPHHLASQYRVIACAYFWLLLTAGLGVLTAIGLRPHGGWGRWTGFALSSVLLLGFPWFTAAGALSFYLLAKPSRLPPPKKAFWDPTRQSGLLLVLSGAGWVFARSFLHDFVTYAQSLGLPHLRNYSVALPYFLLLFFGHVVLHEAGHALVARMVGFSIRSFGLGPFTWHRKSGVWRFQLDWKHALGGYVGAAPVSEDGIRWKECVVVGAGPGASLAGGVMMLLAIPLLPGTALAAAWNIFAMASLVGFYFCALNLVPLGYSDGTILFHLILRTKRGEERLAGLAKLVPRASAGATTVRDPLEEVKAARELLRQISQQYRYDRGRLATAHFRLGAAELSARLYLDAEANLLAALNFSEGMAGATGMRAGCWKRLHSVYRARHKRAEERRAYREALAGWEELLETAPPSGGPTLRLSIVNLHMAAREYEAALPQIDAAMSALLDTDDTAIGRAWLWKHRAECELQLSRASDGLASAEKAAHIFRGGTGRLPDSEGLALLGSALWNAGQTEQALPLIAEGVQAAQTCGDRFKEQRFRLLLADCFKRLDRLAEAACALPQPMAVTAGYRSQFLEQRGSIRLRAGRLDDALADYSEKLELVVQESPDDEIALATVRGALAAIHERRDEIDIAETLALQAHQVLSSAASIQIIGPCVTLAIVRRRRSEPADAYLDEALRCFEDDPMLGHGNKSRSLAYAAQRLDAAGLLEQAERFRRAAAEHSAAVPTITEAGARDASAAA